MSFDNHKNFAYTVVTTAPVPATSGTTLVVSDGTVFPAAPFNITIWPVNVQPLSSNAEIARVTAITTNTLTITRAQEGSVARAIVVGDQVALTITAKTLTDAESLAATSSIITTIGTQTALALPSGNGPLVILANNASTLTVQGIAAGLDGQRLKIVSIGAGSIILQHQNAGASAANRIVVLQGSDSTMTAGASAVDLVYDLTNARWRISNSSGTNFDFVIDNKVCDGRLTLTSGTPVTSGDVTGATNIYWTPYIGSRIALYNGSAWAMYTFTEITQALGTLTSGLPYDVFAYNNSGTVATEILAWTNTTTRATALVLQDGVYVKSGATTRRYLGTFYTTSTTATEDSKTKRYVWNYYNRKARLLRVGEATATWTYTSATIRQANGNTANQVEVVVGVAEAPLSLSLKILANANAASNIYATFGIGEDSTTAFSTVLIGSQAGLPSTTMGANSSMDLNLYPVVGRHYYAWLEQSDGATPARVFGTQNSLFTSGINGWIEG